jgi:protease I
LRGKPTSLLKNKLFRAVFAVFWVVLCPVLSFSVEEMAMKKAVMVIAHEGFRDEELFVPKKVLEKGGIEVKIASTALTPARGKLGGSSPVDMLLKDIRVLDFDAVVFIGGPGSVGYWDDPVAHKLLRESLSAGKITAGICSAAATLAKAGILRGRRATVFPEDAGVLIDNGAAYTATEVERDGNIITAAGPQAAEGFGEEVLKALK